MNKKEALKLKKGDIILVQVTEREEPIGDVPPYVKLTEKQQTWNKLYKKLIVISSYKKYNSNPEDITYINAVEFENLEDFEFGDGSQIWIGIKPSEIIMLIDSNIKMKYNDKFKEFLDASVGGEMWTLEKNKEQMVSKIAKKSK